MLQLRKFRVGQETIMREAFTNFLKINYGQNVALNCEDFIKEFIQLRNTLSYIPINEPENIIDNFIKSSYTYIKILYN